MAPTVSCRLCGVVIRDDDSIVEVAGLEPPIVHTSCGEAARLPGVEWDHIEARTYTEWARGIGWGSSAG